MKLAARLVATAALALLALVARTLDVVPALGAGLQSAASLCAPAAPVAAGPSLRLPRCGVA